MNCPVLAKVIIKTKVMIHLVVFQYHSHVINFDKTAVSRIPPLFQRPKTCHIFSKIDEKRLQQGEGEISYAALLFPVLYDSLNENLVILFANN